MEKRMEWKQLLTDVRVRALADPTQQGTRRQGFEIRTEIQRDYGRAVFSTPIRRLQDKAQVFPLEPIDAVRTRLTHSLEVSSVARDLASKIGSVLVESDAISAVQASAIESIAATCGLIHDTGNPPFGHSGELAIRSRLEEHMDELNLNQPQHEIYLKDLLFFEGNAQTLRLISKLQVLTDHHGLNFTGATFSADGIRSSISTARALWPGLDCTTNLEGRSADVAYAHVG
jgi:dGTPase